MLNPSVILSVSWTLALLITVVTSLRLYLAPTYRVTCYILSISLLWILAQTCLTTYLLSQEVVYGLDTSYDTGYENLVHHPAAIRKYFRIAFANMINYYGILWTVKAGVCSVFWGMERGFSRRLRKMFYAVLAWTVVSGVATIVSFLAWCRPIGSAWVNPLTSPWCDFQHLSISSIGLALNLSSDLLLFTFAILLIHNSTSSARHSNSSGYSRAQHLERCGIVFMLSVGLLSMSSSAVRFYWINLMTVAQVKGLGSQHPLMLWSQVELCCAQTASCLPAFRAVVRGRRERREGKSWSSTEGSRLRRSVSEAASEETGEEGVFLREQKRDVESSSQGARSLV